MLIVRLMKASVVSVFAFGLITLMTPMFSFAADNDLCGDPSQIYEYTTRYSNSGLAAEITFSIVAENVPAGARIRFYADSALPGGRIIGSDWVTVIKPLSGDVLNPFFEISSSAFIETGDKIVFHYDIDLCGTNPPDSFRIRMRAMRITPT